MITRRALLSLVPGVGVSAISPQPLAPQSAQSAVSVETLGEAIAIQRTHLASLYEWRNKAETNPFHEPYRQGIQQLIDLAEKRLKRLLDQVGHQLDDLW